MDLFDFFITALAFWGSYKLGQMSVILPIAKRLHEAHDRGEINLLEDDKEDVDQETRLRIERHAEGYFAYDMDGNFMANGQTFDELFTRFKLRYPEGGFRIVKNAEFTDAERAELVATINRIFGETRVA